MRSIKRLGDCPVKLFVNLLRYDFLCILVPFFVAACFAAATRAAAGTVVLAVGRVSLFNFFDEAGLGWIVDTTLRLLYSRPRANHELHDPVLLILHIAHPKQLLRIQPLLMDLFVHVALAFLQVLFEAERRSLISVLHFSHDLVIGAHYAAFFMMDGVEVILLG